MTTTHKHITHASLFSGIGGFDLAAEWAGFDNLFNCEIDPWCRERLAYYWPNAKQYEDITTADFTIWRGRISILTGGFPCQPFSTSGNRGGAFDPRYMWPEMYRAVCEINPDWVIAENVSGLVNWSKGLVFERVCADLEAAGYEVWTFDIPACCVGAFHSRRRIWFVANALRERLPTAPIYDRATPKEQVRSECKMPSLETVIADDFRSESNKHGVIDGIPEGLDECSIKAYGNAIAPQVVFQIFESIKEYEKL